MNFTSIIDYLCEQFDSSNFNKDILKYGLEVLIYNLFTLIILFLLSLIFKNFDFGIIFIPLFCILRITIGGFHCKTIYGCTILMITIYTSINYIISIPVYHSFLKYFSLLLILLLFFIKPCEENTLHLKNYNIYYKNIFRLLTNYMKISNSSIKN